MHLHWVGMIRISVKNIWELGNDSTLEKEYTSSSTSPSLAEKLTTRTSAQLPEERHGHEQKLRKLII